jgi:hypothetical protein
MKLADAISNGRETTRRSAEVVGELRGNLRQEALDYKREEKLERRHARSSATVDASKQKGAA